MNYNGRAAEEPRVVPVVVKKTEEKNKKIEKMKTVDLASTFISVDNKAAGLEFDDFLPKVNPEVENMKVLNEISENHKNFLNVLQRRSENIFLILK